jgi:hypothetical protein
MSSAQQAAINEAVEREPALDPTLLVWLEAGGRAKNLETVQGDECDTMILSLGYGRDAAGRLIMNFGPLGQSNGERRLNVAVTRARWQTMLVSSIHAADIRDDGSLAQGARRLRDYLDYAERGAAALPAAATSAGEPTPVERTIAAALAAHGLDADAHVGIGGYRVELAVREPAGQRYHLAVESDGPLYRAAATARDRDLLRPLVLRRMGWVPHRTWSTAFWRDPKGELARVLARTVSPDGPTIVSPPRHVAAAEFVRANATTDYAPWVERAALRIPPDADLAGQPTESLGRSLLQVVEECGPLHLEDLFRQVSDAYGRAQLTARTRAALQFALQQLIGAAKVTLRGDFAWPPGLAPGAAPVRRIAEGQERRAERVPPEEAARALLLACRHGGRIPREAAGRAVSTQLGFRRTGPAIETLAAQAVDIALAAGWVRADGDYLIPTDEEAISPPSV